MIRKRLLTAWIISAIAAVATVMAQAFIWSVAVRGELPDRDGEFVEGLAYVLITVAGIGMLVALVSIALVAYPAYYLLRSRGRLSGLWVTVIGLLTGGPVLCLATMMFLSSSPWVTLTVGATAGAVAAATFWSISGLTAEAAGT